MERWAASGHATSSAGVATVGRLLRIAQSSVGAALILTLACGGGSPSSPAGTHALHGEVSDPTGDALTSPQVPIAPDLVQGTADVLGGDITFTIRLAPGTLTGATVLNIRLDTDQDASTGLFGGTDYIVGMGEGYGDRAIVTRYAGTATYAAVGDVPVRFVSDGISVTVPLSLLGNDDGKLNFRVLAFTRPSTTTVFLHDDMPDALLAPGLVQ